MNKFGRPKEEDFRTVRKVVEKMAKKAPEIMLVRLTSISS